MIADKCTLLVFNVGEDSIVLIQDYKLFELVSTQESLVSVWVCS